jgi:hypothetical protein
MKNFKEADQILGIFVIKNCLYVYFFILEILKITFNNATTSPLFCGFPTNKQFRVKTKIQF